MGFEMPVGEWTELNADVMEYLHNESKIGQRAFREPQF